MWGLRPTPLPRQSRSRLCTPMLGCIAAHGWRQELIIEQYQRFGEDVTPAFAGRSEMVGAAV